MRSMFVVMAMLIACAAMAGWVAKPIATADVPVAVAKIVKYEDNRLKATRNYRPLATDKDVRQVVGGIPKDGETYRVLAAAMVPQVGYAIVVVHEDGTATAYMRQRTSFVDLPVGATVYDLP